MPRTPPLPEPKDGVWEGTAEQLLHWLNDHVPFEVRPKSWPRTPRVLSQKLRRLVRSLRHAGVVVELDWPLGSGAVKQRGIRVRRKEVPE